MRTSNEGLREELSSLQAKLQAAEESVEQVAAFREKMQRLTHALRRCESRFWW